MTRLVFQNAHRQPIDDLAPHDMNRWAAMIALPGEIVRLRDADRPFPDEKDADASFEARKALEGRDLTVATSTAVLSDGGGTIRFIHTFEGIPGEYAGGAFVDKRPVEYLYGTMITLDDELWVVPMDPDKVALLPERPAFKVVGMERCARHQLMDGYSVDEAEGKEAADFQEFRDAMREPATGELHVVTEPNGDRKLFAAPWTSSCTQEEILLANEAVATIAGARAPKA